MSYNSTTKTITAPVSIHDVQQCLGVSDNDLGTLCSHANVNPYSKYKPLKASVAGVLPSNSQITLYHGGISPVFATSLDAFKTAVLSALSNADYKDRNSIFRGWKYNKPTGGAHSPYRLSDFDGYKHNASYFESVLDGMQVGSDDFPAIEMAVQNSTIDVSSIYATDVALPDDTAKITYYINHIKSTNRSIIHILDILFYNNFAFDSSWARGIMFISPYNDILVSTDTIPWKTDRTWASTLASPTGRVCRVLDFYYNKNTKYCVAIPDFTMDVKIYTDAIWTTFVNVAPGDPYDFLEISYSMQGDINQYYSIRLMLQLYNNGIWDNIRNSQLSPSGTATVDVKIGSNTNIKGIYEEVVRADAYTWQKARVQVIVQKFQSSESIVVYTSEETDNMNY